MARKTLLDLDPKIGKAIIDAITMGVPDASAVAAAGVALSAFYKWIEKGTDAPARDATDTRGPVPARKARSPYKEFAEALHKARGGFVVNHVKLLTRAAQGTVTTITTTHPDGRVEVRTEHKGDGDIRASKFLLSVRDPENFSERHIVENRLTNATGKGPVVIEAGGELRKALADLASLPAPVRDRLAGIATDDLAPAEEEDEPR